MQFLSVLKATGVKDVLNSAVTVKNDRISNRTAFFKHFTWGAKRKHDRERPHNLNEVLGFLTSSSTFFAILWQSNCLCNR